MTSKAASPKTTKPSAATSESVESFLATLDHPANPAILALRKILLAADPAITEGLEWNAPSFRTTEHFATMNLRVKAGVGVILHFGAKKNAISTTGVAIPDPGSLLEWLAKDRALVTFRDLKDVEAKRPAFVEVLREWIKHV